MKRGLALLVLGFVVVWAAALLDFDVRTAMPVVAAGVPEPSASPGADAPAGAAPVPQVSDPKPPAPAETPVLASNGAHPPAQAAGLAAKLERAVQSGFALIGKATKRAPTPQAVTPSGQPAQKAPAREGTGELGEGILSPEFVEYEQKYAREVRDGDWASAQEERLNELLNNQTFADEVGLVHCQQTLCRIVLESDMDAKNTFQKLIGIPGLHEQTGLGPDTPYSLRSGQLSVYFRAREATSAL
jgi:hypothetical protein